MWCTPPEDALFAPQWSASVVVVRKLFVKFPRCTAIFVRGFSMWCTPLQRALFVYSLWRKVRYIYARFETWTRPLRLLHGFSTQNITEQNVTAVYVDRLSHASAHRVSSVLRCTEDNDKKFHSRGRILCRHVYGSRWKETFHGTCERTVLHFHAAYTIKIFPGGSV